MNGGAEAPGRQRGKHLVDVHVRGGARAGLIGINRELVVVRSGDELVGRRSNRGGDGRVENANLRIDERRGLLDARERDDLPRLKPGSADREVLDRALRLRGVQRIDGYEHFAHGVVLGAEFSHDAAFLEISDVNVGDCRAFEEAVVRSDNSQRTRGDRVADELG
jgi:hypothetical protein